MKSAGPPQSTKPPATYTRPPRRAGYPRQR
nr:MAG TPA: hypothetical protein [Caudoviricetes sp.]